MEMDQKTFIGRISQALGRDSVPEQISDAYDYSQGLQFSRLRGLDAQGFPAAEQPGEHQGQRHGQGAEPVDLSVADHGLSPYSPRCRRPEPRSPHPPWPPAH